MLCIYHIYSYTTKIKYSKPYDERGFERLHLVQVKITSIRDYVQEGTIYSWVWEGFILLLAGTDCGVWYLEDNDDKVQYWPKSFYLR